MRHSIVPWTNFLCRTLLFVIASAALLVSGPVSNSAWAAPAGKSEGKAAKGGKQPPASPTMNESVRLNDKGVAQIKAREFAAAEETLEKALRVEPGNISAVFNLATALLINKKESAAIILLSDYTKKVPDDAGLWVRLGDAYLGTKDVTKAVESYETALKLAPDYVDLPAKLATVYLLQNNSVKAEEMLVRAVEQNPRDHKLLTNLSNLYLGNGKPDKAVSTAKKALQIKATKEVYVTLASAYETMKDYKNSLISYQRAVDLGENREEVMKKIEGLKKVVS